MTPALLDLSRGEWCAVILTVFYMVMLLGFSLSTVKAVKEETRRVNRWTS